jgi:hypothetical protein
MGIEGKLRATSGIELASVDPASTPGFKGGKGDSLKVLAKGEPSRTTTPLTSSAAPWITH